MKKNIFLFLLIFMIALKGQTNQEIPIIALPGVPEGEFTTVENYLKLKNAGFNVNHVQFSTTENIIKALDVAERTGIKLLVYSWDLQQRPEEVVPLIMNHKALFGYFIYDEVRPEQFSFVRSVYERVKKIDSKHVIYANAYPNYVPIENLKGLTYKQYLDAYMTEMPFQILSFDNYPVINNKVRGDWYENLEDIRDISKKHNVPFWAFACTAIHFSYPKPTLASIRLQQYSNLIYGAKALQYYTYWSYSDSNEWKRDKYGYAVVYKDGTSTPTYNIVKQVNTEIKNLEFIFKDSTVESLFHMGANIPTGTKILKNTPKGFSSFNTTNQDVIVSMIKNKDKHFLIVQNKDLHSSINFKFLRNPNYKISFVNKKGKVEKVSSKLSTVKIMPGDILIFTY